MQAFLLRHQDHIVGVLHGFDRVLFKGTLCSISHGSGVDRFLGAQHVRYADFGRFVERLSEQLRAQGQQLAQQAGRPYQYVESSSLSKEQLALEIARRDGIQEGLVCVLRCVEPCQSFVIRRGADGHFGFVAQERKCLHLYFYYLDREFGLMHLRLATWLPFGIQVCLNGREYLARRMRQAGIGFEQRGNCFSWIADVPRAQQLMDELLERKWERFLGALAKRINPLVAKLALRPYYWSMRESEYATDVMFKDAVALARIYPDLVSHAMQQMNCRDTMRFLGRRIVMKRFAGEATTSLLVRSEGVRVKHYLHENSIKMYDKQGRVLRVETTINNPRRFKVRRPCVRNRNKSMRWIPMRFGLADLQRRVEVSRAANERYLEALAVVKVPERAKVLLDPISRRVVQDQRPYRALRPVSAEEAKLFQAVLSGQFTLQGFTNRQLRRLLEGPEPADPQQQRRQSGRVTRLLRLLRAHRLIRKVSGTRYYRTTPQGRQVMTAALSLREADLATLAA